MKHLFVKNRTPVAIYPSRTGVKGLIKIYINPRGTSSEGSIFKAAILAVEGSKAANVQVTANLDNKAYYTLFGEKLGTYVVTCADVTGSCGKGASLNVKRLKDAVNIMNSAVQAGNLPSVKLAYSSDGESKPVIIQGYLTDIKFGIQEKYKGYMTLIIKGYSR